jgi:putative pantetheine hydrolase
MNELADRQVGLAVGPGPGEVVPLVPGAVLFDLGRGGDFRARPDASFGLAALIAADAAPADGTDHPGAAQGNVGAGTGAVTGHLKGGIGTASLVLSAGVIVGALAAVNAAGSPIDPRTGELLGARLLLPGDGPAPPVPDAAGRAALLVAMTPRTPGIDFSASSAAAPSSAARESPVITNTTLAVVATDATLTKAQCTKLAQVAQNGMARALNPVHTMVDGDVVFGAATCTAAAPDQLAFHELVAAAADVLTRSIVRALLSAETVATAAGRWPNYADVIARERPG